MVGSSWNSAEVSGDAPMLSPADTTNELRTCERSCFTCVAR